MTYSFNHHEDTLRSYKLNAETMYRVAAGLMVGEYKLNDNCISPFEAAAEIVDYADDLLMEAI